MIFSVFFTNFRKTKILIFMQWKLSVLTENWHTWYLGSADSQSGLSFWNSDPKIHFWANLCQKSQICFFYLKIGTHVISRLLILVPILVFWISKPKSIFVQIRTEKLEVVQFGWKLAHRVSRQCWFLFQHYVSKFPTLNTFLDKFGSNNSDNSFLNCQPLDKFESKNLNSPLCLEAGTQSILECDCKNTRQGLEEKIKMNNLLNACCSYILIVAKSKKLNQSTKECWLNRIIVAIKIFLIKKVLLQLKLWNKIKTTYEILHNGPSI